MTTDRPDPPDIDAEIVAGLRRIFARVDPMPPVFDQAVRLAMATADLDADVARLVEDVRDTVRGDGSRTLRFASEDATLLLNLAARAGGRVRMDGWLQPAREATVTVRHDNGRDYRTSADAAGRFALDDLPGGAARVLVALPGGQRIATPVLRL